MAVSARLFNRNLSGLALPLPPNIQTSVNSYSMAAMGGPRQAQLSVSGPPDSLAQAFTWLRCPVEIVGDGQQNKVWWGYVAEVHLRIGQVELVMTLDSMVNTASVAYVRLDSHTHSGSRATTTDSLDADSIAEYGAKALRVSLNNATDIQAANLANRILSERKYPQPIGPSFGAGADTPVSVTLDCRGWWETLKWKYYSAASLTEQQTLEDYNERWGLLVPDPSAHPTKIAQRFSLPGGTTPYYLSQVSANITLDINTAYPSTAFNISCDLYSNSSNAPNTLLASSTPLPASDTFSDAGWPVWTFSTPYLLSASTNYWLVFACSIVPQNVRWMPRYHAHGFTIYPRGAMNWYTSGAWTGIDTSIDVQFIASAIQDTAIQAQGIINTAGQFITSSRLDGFTGSGISTSAYRDGDRTGLTEAEELLSAGTSGNIRMLATVTPERQVVLSVEPLPAITPYQIDSQMLLYDAYGNRAGEERCPAGVWMALRNVLPVSAAFSKLMAPSPFFVEEGRYDARTNRYMPSPRALGNIFKVGIQP